METERLVLGALMPGMREERLEPWLADAIGNGVESVCLFADAIGTPQRTRATVAQLRAVAPSLLVATDEEGGDVTRLQAVGGSGLLSPLALGAIDEPTVTRASGRLLAGLLRSAGVDWTLAPVADVNVDPRNPVIGVRSFGAEAESVAVHVAAYIDGVQEGGVATAAKHFPGHGDTHVDSHESLPVLDLSREAIAQRELLPFRAAIASGAAAIMTGHVLVPSFDATAPATLSRAVTHDLLRIELGFDGVIITDAVEMGAVCGPDRRDLAAAAVACLRAGADVVCLGAADQRAALADSATAVLAALSDGTLDVATLVDAARRRAHLRGKQVVRRAADAADEELVARFAPRSVSIAGDVRLAAGPVTVMRVSPGPGYAAGHTTWGVAPFLNAAGHEAEYADADRLGDGVDGRAIVIEIRDPWKRPDQMALLTSLVQRLPQAVVVDMGWPTEQIPGARGWIATRGTGLLASALAAAALLNADAAQMALDVIRATQRGAT